MGSSHRVCGPRQLSQWSDDHLFIKERKNVALKRQKPGLREIANAARVSMATVSRVLNGNSRVDPLIQQTVLDSAANLGIDLSQWNKTKSVAFVLSNRAMLHAFHSRILAAAEAHCAANGWDMVFLTYNYSPHVSWKELHLPRILQHQGVVRAVILAGTNSTNLLQLLAHKSITFSVLGNNVIGAPEDLKNKDVVLSDDIQGGYDMTQYLIGLGHRSIGFVGNSQLPWFARCLAGYRRALDEAGLPAQLSTTDSEDDAESGYLGTKSLLANQKSVTAILAGNDHTARGVYKALRDSGRSIPNDISVAGCDDTVGGWLHPALTTTREFPEQLGKQLVQLTLNRIAKPDLEPQQIIVPTELVKRDSCCPIPTTLQPLSGMMREVMNA
jgi:DNA-binding LacI/PurR family transcriptional regulator